jgi:hypothetical protein
MILLQLVNSVDKSHCPYIKGLGANRGLCDLDFPFT